MAVFAATILLFSGLASGQIRTVAMTWMICLTHWEIQAAL
jgi:hypothetical protein